ncbi:MAG: preprotein translocase subunit SecE [Candidatus Brocadiales bacterium]
MEVYKKNQGIHARLFLAGALGALACFASYAIYGTFIELPQLYPGAEVPLVGIKLTWGFAFAAIFLVICAAIIGVLTTGPETGLRTLDANSKKSVEFLIDTQGELQKVSWPTRTELVGSTGVVIILLVILGVYIFWVDWVITRIMRFIGFL